MTTREIGGSHKDARRREVSAARMYFSGYFKGKEYYGRGAGRRWLVFHSGDLCVMDENRSIRIIGRKKDMIVRGGENLNSNEINDNLEGLSGVGEHARLSVWRTTVLARENLCLYRSGKRAGKVWCWRMCFCLLSGAGEECLNGSGRNVWKLIDQFRTPESRKVKKYLLQEELKKRMEAQKSVFNIFL